MSEIKAWGSVAQQLDKMNVDVASMTAANVSQASGDVFFVGRPNQDGQTWSLKKITPEEMGKLIYNYLTSSSVAAQLAAVLGAQCNWLSEGQNIDNILTPGDYAVGSNSIAQSLTGTLPPLDPIVAFRLEVRNTMGGRPVQRYYDFNGNSFSRAFNGSVWTSWSR